MFLLPSIALTGYSVILVAPVLGLVRVLKVLENSTDYSIQNTVSSAAQQPEPPQSAEERSGITRLQA